MCAEVRVIVTKIGGEAVDSNVFSTVCASDRDELPLFSVHLKRLLKGARA